MKGNSILNEIFCPKVNSIVEHYCIKVPGIWSCGCPYVSNNFIILFSNSSIKRLLLEPAELLNMKFQWHLVKHFRIMKLQIKFVQQFLWLATDLHSDWNFLKKRIIAHVKKANSVFGLTELGESVCVCHFNLD